MTQTKQSVLANRAGHPSQGEVVKVYTVTQPVDVASIQIPKHLGTAAVIPSNGDHVVPRPGGNENKKQ